MNSLARPESIKTIYMVAICGTGMASLAGLLKESGYRVEGSDLNVYPPMSLLLERANITVRPGWKKENIPDDADLIIIGNAVSKNNEEVQAVLEKGLPYMSFPQALAHFFLEGRRSLVVAGTHGKTTTASLLSWTLSQCGLRPGFMIGGWLKNFDGNYRLPESDLFVSEGDEYDTAFFDKEPKFLHYQPHAAILTGVEFDHADIFKDFDHFRSAFKKFTALIDPKGFLLAEATQKIDPEILSAAPCTVETYGFTPEADWAGSNYKATPQGIQFDLSYKGQAANEFRLPMLGQHNADNALAVAAMALKLGADPKDIAQGFATFKGVKRRQDVRGEKNGVAVIDDFAHHPTAIRKTIEAVKEGYPQGRVWAVFEPRSATSRRNTFQDAFPSSFAPAHAALIAKLYAPEKIPVDQRLDPQAVVDAIHQNGGTALYLPETEDIINHLAQHCRPGDVVLVMSSGGFDDIHNRLLNRL